MIRYVIKRILLLIPVILALSFVVFALVELMPGTFVDQLIAGEMTPEEIDALRAQYDLDRTMLYRYGKYMLNLVQGSLGVSMSFDQDVFGLYMQRLPNTLILILAATIIGLVVSIPAGIRAARKAGTVTDAVTTTFALIGVSMPVFWLGLLMMLLFALYLGWLPSTGHTQGIRSLIMPAVCSSLTLMALCTRQTRSSMLDVLSADFLRTARAKGVPEKNVIWNHALGNALIPIITVVGASVCTALAGSAVVEQVFAWPGVGSMLVYVVRTRDTTAILGCVILTSIIYVVLMLAVDLLYGFADPRIRAQYVTKKSKRAPAEMPGFPSADPVPAAAAVEPEYREAAAAIADVEASAKKDDFVPSSPDPAPPPAPDPQEQIAASEYVTRENRDIMLAGLTDDGSDVMAKYKKRGQMAELWRMLKRSKGAMAGLFILGFVALVAIASLFMPFSWVNASNVMENYSPPSMKYLFGTDNMGRDLFLRVVYGARYSLIIGFGAMLFSAISGTALGATAGYFGGMTDNLIMRICDVMASIPGLMLGMVIMVVLGMNMMNLIIAVGLGGAPHFIRVARASVLTVRGNEYVEASRAIGFSDVRIMLTQVLPNGLSPILVQATMSIGFSIMVSASLSFLGFGVPPPAPEWGALISSGREAARTAPWLMAFPGIAIMITILGSNLLGDGLRDALDPKMKK